MFEGRSVDGGIKLLLDMKSPQSTSRHIGLYPQRPNFHGILVWIGVYMIVGFQHGL